MKMNHFSPIFWIDLKNNPHAITTLKTCDLH